MPHALPAPRFFSGGFRPFFLFGALQAALMIALWVPWFLGFIHVPTALSPVAWHQHELLFGFVPAMIAGFLLTAVPNWTGRPGLSGAPLAALFCLWLAGRFAIAGSQWIGMGFAAAISLAFIPVLALILLRELIAAKNKRNYKLIGVLTVFFLAQLAFHYEFARYGMIEMAGRLAIATIILLIAIIGGRITPTFTGNWLRKNNPGRELPPFGKVDLVAMVVSGLALLSWVAAVKVEALALPAGLLAVLAGLLQFYRQLRWQPQRTLREPLVAMLHASFAFVPLGFLITGAALLTGAFEFESAGVHAWTSGAIGATTLAVMTRATRGHTGQALFAPFTTTAFIYAPILLSALLRIGAALWPGQTMLLLPLAAVLWVVAFLGYAVFYGPLILRKG